MRLIILVFLVFQSYLFAKEPLAAFKLDSLWYVIDYDGNTLLGGLKIKSIDAYSEGYFLIRIDLDGRTQRGFMTKSGKLALVEYDELKPFKEGMAVIGKRTIISNDSSITYYGYINTKGEVIIKPQYLEAFDFSDSLAWVMNNERRGYINKKGNLVIEYKGTDGFGNNFSEGYASFVNDSAKFGYINKNGEIVIDFLFDEAGDFREGLARVNNLGFWGFINKQGKLVVKYSYDFASDFSGGFAFVGIPDSVSYKPVWSLISRTGARMFDFKYYDFRDFSEGLACVSDGVKWKYIDPQDNQIINEYYDIAEQFRDGLAFVRNNNKEITGYINPFGELVLKIPEQATEIIDLRLNKKVK